jgi:FMN hydrolase / 5-amino-6-(5-phospho-D-ribitylamino)uracil phosphatase
MINVAQIQAISFDLDDTLWPIAPTLERAEAALHAWLTVHSPMTAALYSSAEALRDIREYIRIELPKRKPELKYDLGAMRLEAIRLAMYRSGEDPLLAKEAYQVFYAARNKVDLFSCSRGALAALSARYPLAALSNGNADIQLVGLGEYFKVVVNAREAKMAKPDTRIFDLTALKLGVANAHVLHVGDDATLDCMGALQAGMQTVWVNRSDAQWQYGMPQPMTVSNLSELLVLLA